MIQIKTHFSRFVAAFRPFWLGTSVIQALAEAWMIALVILFAANYFSDDLTNYNLGNIIFFTSCIAGLWAALRARITRGMPWKQTLKEEVLTGAALGALALAGVLLPLMLFNQVAFITRSNIGIEVTIFLLACSGLAYYAARAFIRLLSYWNHLRRSSLMWSLTNAQLSVVMFTALFAAVLVIGYMLIAGTPADISQQMPPAPRFISHLLSTVLPVIGIFLVLTTMILALLLPPSAIFSFFFSRLVTRRLQHLIQAAQRFRSGDYTARVPLQGEDEIAQLQSDFNSMAETLEHTLQELGTTLQELREEQSRVKELLQFRRELVASVSHELRTPVATLRGYLDAALDTPAPAPEHALHADLVVMRREAVRLQTLIDDLFTLSRAEAQGLPLEVKPVDLHGLIHERVAALAPLAWQAGRVEVIADIPPDLPLALADPGRLEQVIVNLLRNAIRYTPPGGIVAVIAGLADARQEDARQEDARLRIDVRDTGQGIAPADLPHVWERFYRGGDTETALTSGAGLGLALVKELTEAMGGTACVESQSGQGSCFTIYLKTTQ